jgi:hypothetical protein
MKKRMENAAAIFAAARAGEFCDIGHYYCAQFTDGRLIFPSGAMLTPDGVFRGPPRLAERLERIPADWRPAPVPCWDRPPQLSKYASWEKRLCAHADGVEQGLVEEALAIFDREGYIMILEECDCGERIRHNNGGNPHWTWEACREDSKFITRWSTGYELLPPSEEEEVSETLVRETIVSLIRSPGWRLIHP